LNEVIDHIIKLPKSLPPVLGVGAYLKNNICLIQDNEAWISKEIGSLDNPKNIKLFYKIVENIIDCAKYKPVAVAHDFHTDFPSTIWAKESGLRSIPVQHHYAHIASVMAQNNYEGKAIGIALDGFGLGYNNELWGGELLYIDQKTFKRIGHLKQLHQVGGDIASIQPWRMGASALYSIGKKDQILKRYSKYPNAKYIIDMIENNINSPLTSSAGRLFDAVCGLLNVNPISDFEGQAPMNLEKMVTSPKIENNAWEIENNILNMNPLLEKISNCTKEDGANIFHGTFAFALMDWFKKASKESDIKTIIFGGGCFLNKVLCNIIKEEMKNTDYNLLWSKELSAGDQSISLGQAYAGAIQVI